MLNLTLNQNVQADVVFFLQCLLSTHRMFFLLSFFFKKAADTKAALHNYFLYLR